MSSSAIRTGLTGRHRAKRVEAADADGVGLGRVTGRGGAQQRDLERVKLRWRQACQLLRRHTVEQVDERREREPRLGVTRSRHEHADAPPARRLDAVLPQRRLADARPADQEQAGTAGIRVQERVKLRELRPRVRRPHGRGRALPSPCLSSGRPPGWHPQYHRLGPPESPTGRWPGKDGPGYARGVVPSAPQTQRDQDAESSAAAPRFPLSPAGSISGPEPMSSPNGIEVAKNPWKERYVHVAATASRCEIRHEMRQAHSSGDSSC